MDFDRKKIIAEFYDKLPAKDKPIWLKYRKACQESLFFFIKYIGGSARRSGGDISPYLHKPFLDSWQDMSVTRQGVAFPRGWRKTTCGILADLWEWTRDPEITILLPSEKQDTAAMWIQQMSNHVLRNERLRWQYPEFQMVDDDWVRTHRWSSLYLDLPRLGYYPEPTISCVGIRGAAQGGHFSLIDGDDLVGEKGAESSLVLEDALRWLDNLEELLIQPSRTAPDASRVRLRGTHWGPGDYIEQLQERYPEYIWYVAPCLKVEVKNKSNVIYLQHPDAGLGESNFPEGGTTEHYIDMKANPDKEMVFWAQHMNMPTGASKTTKFDYNWLRWYTIETRPASPEARIMSDDKTEPDTMEVVVCDDGKEFPLSHIMKYGLIDPGGFADTKLMKGSSRNALIVAGQPDNSVRKFIFAADAKRFKEPKDFMDILFDLHVKWRVRLWKIETIAAQKYIYRDIIEEKRKRGINISIVPLPPDVGKDAKDARIIGLIDPCSRGEYFLRREMKDMIGEYKSYPSGLTKDLIDMWGVYNREFAKRKEREPVRPEPEWVPQQQTGDEEVGADGRSELAGY